MFKIVFLTWALNTRTTACRTLRQGAKGNPFNIELVVYIGIHILFIVPFGVLLSIFFKKNFKKHLDCVIYFSIIIKNEPAIFAMKK